MSKVQNIHLGREMGTPRGLASNKQIAYIFDTNKCISVRPVTVACKTAWTAGKRPGAHLLQQRRDQALWLFPARLG